MEAPVSSVQVTLRNLMADGLVVGQGQRKHRTYRLAAGAATTHLLALATTLLPIGRQLRIIGRVDDTIEFLARRDAEVIVVFAAGSDAMAESSAARSLEAICDVAGLQVRYLYHDDVRRELLASPALREHMAAADIIHGELNGSFPDRTSHGVSAGRPLGRPHQALRLPSRRLLRRLAHEHELAGLRLFGSAIRSDFRPDSDVDLAVRYRPGVRPSLESMLDLERDLERAIGHDVDLVKEELLHPRVQEALEKEAVALL